MSPLTIHSIVTPPADFEPLPPDALDSSLVSLIERTIERYPHRIAIRDQGREISYAELNTAANALAYAILDFCGRGSEPVIFILGHEAKALIALLAIIKSGRPYLPLSPDYPLERLRFIVSESNSPLILTDTKYTSLVETIQQNALLGVLNVDEVAPATERGDPGILVDAGEPAGILYTSGSTGEPKGVVMSHRFIVFQALGDFDTIYCSASDRFALLNSLSFTAARPPVYNSWFSGATICMYDIRSLGVAGVSDWLTSEAVTVLFSMTPVFRAIFSSLPERVFFPSLRLVWVSGDICYASDVELGRAHTLPYSVFRNSLGSSEGGLVAMNLLTRDTTLQGEVVPIGYPIPGKEVSLEDENGQVVAQGEVGEIVIRSRFLASGYWKSPELTASKFQTDPHDPRIQIFRTGDLGRWNREGKLEHLGRSDNQVKIRGFRVDLAEIEGILREHPDIKNVTVVTRQETSWPIEKQLVSYIVTRSGAAISSVDLRNYLAVKLPDYMLPAFFVFLPELPLNENGKVDRRALPEPTRQVYESVRVALVNEEEKKLLHLWVKLFGLDDIGVDENFFELGGDSFLAARLFTEIENVFEKIFPANVLLRHGTIRQLAKLIRGAEGYSAGFLIPLRATGTRPPLFLVPGGGTDVLTLLELVEALGEDQPVYGFQDFHAGHPESLYMQGIVRASQEFVRAMQEVQPRGPYHLAGHSFGGLVAFEMARQLSVKGEAVGLLGLLDAFPPASKRRSGTLKNRILTHARNLAGRDLRGKLDYLSERFKLFLNRLIKRESLRWFYDSKLVKGILGPDSMQPVRAALADYIPAPYEGHAVIYRATQRPLAITWDVTAPWAEFILGGIKFHDIPSEHKSMVRPPYVDMLAGFIKRDLELYAKAGP